MTMSVILVTSWRVVKVVMFSQVTLTSPAVLAVSPRTCPHTSAKSSTCPTPRTPSWHHQPIRRLETCIMANQLLVKSVQFAYNCDLHTRRQSAELCGGLWRKLIGYCVFNFCLFLLDFNYRRLFWYWEDNQSALGWKIWGSYVIRNYTGVGRPANNDLASTVPCNIRKYEISYRAVIRSHDMAVTNIHWEIPPHDI